MPSDSSLWDQAFDNLSTEERDALRSHEGQLQPQATDVTFAVKQAKTKCVSKQWVLYTNDHGKKVKLREKLDEVVGWVEKFMQVGDVVVSYDPAHAALPWAAVRTLLQVTINDCQTYGMIVENVETVSRIITLYTTVETRVLYRESQVTRQLSTELVKLYTSALRFLASASIYYGKGTLTSSAIGTPMLNIEKQEQEVLKLVSLAEHEVHGMDLQEVKDLLKESQKSVEESNEEQRSLLSAWVNGILTTETYERAGKRQEGTCEWAIQLIEFTQWASNDNLQPRLLWMHAPAGFGKTFISARIIQHLEEQKSGPIAYFFCVADHEGKRDPYAILRSWLTQLLSQDEEVLKMVSEERKSKSGKPLTNDGMWKLFVAIGKAVHRCTFVIDGFDECTTTIDMGIPYHHNEPRNSFLRELLQALAKTNSRLLVVSRDAPDIREYLGRDVSYESDKIHKVEYAITAQDTSEDIQLFSRSIINGKLKNKKEEFRLKLAKHAAEKSDGMFLWIKLLGEKLSPTKNSKALENTVSQMPADISEAYTRELEVISRLSAPEKEEVVMILRWVLFAVVPLQVKQLVEALLVSKEHLDEYPDDELPDEWDDGYFVDDYVKDTILGPCGSLLQIRQSSHDTPLADQTVHFVHFSVKEYLTGLANTTPQSDWATVLGLESTVVEEGRLSNVCLRYLTLERFKDIPQNSERYPFLFYAAWAWYIHSFHEKPAPAQRIIDQTQKAFDPAVSSWKTWTPLMEARLTEPDLDKHYHDANSWGTTLKVQSPMYYASLLGLIDIVKWLEGQGLDCDGKGGGRFGFPLQAAVARGHFELVKYFLNRGVNVSQKGGQFGESIMAAAAVASWETVKVLLEHEADATSTDSNGWTPLHHAAKRGSGAIIELLLDYGANINAATNNRWTAAALACRFGHRDALNVLCQKGADLNPSEEVAIAPLKAAIVGGNSSLVGLLWNKLRAAGIDPDELVYYSMTPLELASGLGMVDTVKALIEAGASVLGNPNRNPKIESPLELAIIHGRIPVVKLLLHHGASLDHIRTHGLTTLMLAVVAEQKAIAKWLLDIGATMQGIDESTQRTAFDEVIVDGDDDTARLLLRKGYFRFYAQNPEPEPASNQDCDSLVMLAFDCDFEGVVKRLTETNGSLASQILTEALHVASVKGHLPIIKQLVEAGAKVGARDMNGRSALHHATAHLHFDAAEFLMNHGARTSIEDSIGSTPIDLAVMNGMAAFDFIQSHMSDLTLSINRRPSLLTDAPTQVRKTSSLKVRRALSGLWVGFYQYMSWDDGVKEPFSIAIPDEVSEGSQSNIFSNTGKDERGMFRFHGFVDPVGTIWFVKLYTEKTGWLYRGELDSDERCLKGRWGSNRKLWHGTFQLELGEELSN
ncbi:hypothetical protein NW762_012631 [Fusarium torreyae]|uniref:NACHT domain-containing protein n=1 Tax=Fusarium torreyae TaxID=1237075 RepID=A0A9W8RRH3_9HYPO|nr:hypothetical protein NW762_012631 [Fusarium torreyae]